MNTLPLTALRDAALRILRGGVDAVDPEPLVGSTLSQIPSHQRPRFIIAAGKAASAMLRGAQPLIDAEQSIVASHDVATRDGGRVATFAAGHPAANGGSVAAAERALVLAARSADRGGLLVLLSGGASAMLAAPADGVGLHEKQETARLLMRAGAAIDELNCVRKHLSRIKGGRLAAAAGATITLALSDVHAPKPDDPSVIGSGPTVPDPTTFRDAVSVIDKYGVNPSESVRVHLDAGLRGAVDETIKPDDARIRSSAYVVIGNRHTAVEGARRLARGLGYDVIVVPEVIVGEARLAGAAFVATALRLSADRQPPVCVVGSGETTVTVTGRGSGGRNQEFALGAALSMTAGSVNRPLVVASAGTDGVDGPTAAAGAIVDGHTIERARAQKLDPDAALTDNDAFPFFSKLGDLIVWGPTGTNVGDVHVVLIG